MGSKPKMPAAPPPAPTAPNLASSFTSKRQGYNAASSLGGTYLTGASQPLIRKQRKATLLGGTV